jgi:pyroglutamyl-peptidase
MKDAKGRYAPLVIPQPKDFSRRGPDGRSAALAERAERERLANPELPNSLPGDINAKQNRGFGGPSYDAFADELNTDLDVTRIIQDIRQLGIEVNAPISSAEFPPFLYPDTGFANYLFIDGWWPLPGRFPLLLFIGRIQAKR